MNKKVDHPGFLKMLDYQITRSNNNPTESIQNDNQIKIGGRRPTNVDNPNTSDSILIV